MNKLLIIATFIILTANNLNAQQYDTYGRSQATREWQETQRHYNSIKPGNKSTTTISGDYNAYGWGDNSKIQQQDEAAKRQDVRWKDWYDKVDKLEALIKSRNLKREPAYFYQLQTAAKDAGFNNYDISVFFGYNAQEYQEKLLKQIREKNGAGDADRAKAEFDRNMENVRKEKKLEQDKKDEAFRSEIAKFKIYRDLAADTAYSTEVRKQGFKEMHNYLNPIIERQKKLNREEYTDVTIRKSIKQGEVSVNRIQNYENLFYIQTKQFELAYKNGNVSTIESSTDNISDLMGNFVYAGLISEKNTTNVILEKAAYAYNLNPNKITHFAYALFLDNDIDGAIDALQKYIFKYPTDTLNRIGYFNKLILLKFYQGKDEEAIKLYNSNSSMAINDKSELLEFIAFNIRNTIKKCMAADENTNYYIYPISTLMDIDLLATIHPTNVEIQELRMKLGKTLNCQRYQSPITELWVNAEKKNSNSTNYIQQLITNGSLSPELRGSANVIGFPVYVPETKVYEQELNELLKYNQKNNNEELMNIEIIKGYLKTTETIIYSDGEKRYRNIFYKIDDLEKPIFSDCKLCYEKIGKNEYYQIKIPLKALKYGYAPDHGGFEIETDERTINFNYTSKSKAEKALKFYTALFEKLQKQ